VLKPTGSMWLNVGDTYSKHTRDGASPKSLLLAPERLALAMIERGWTVRNKVIWAKTNPMPTSVSDRLACGWETLYFATRSRGYYFDLDAIRVPHRSSLRRVSRAAATRQPGDPRPAWAGPNAGNNRGLDRLKASGVVGHPLGKNPGDVWTIPTSNYRGIHHATFPGALIERPLLATCPERTCMRCGTPWRRERHRQLGHLAIAGALHPACSCHTRWQPGIVLDPFMGSGTVAIAAETHKRAWLGIELNPDYAAEATARIHAARAARTHEERDTAADPGPDVEVRAA
jgi:DNA modification methylase